MAGLIVSYVGKLSTSSSKRYRSFVKKQVKVQEIIRRNLWKRQAVIVEIEQDTPWSIQTNFFYQFEHEDATLGYDLLKLLYFSK